MTLAAEAIPGGAVSHLLGAVMRFQGAVSEEIPVRTNSVHRWRFCDHSVEKVPISKPSIAPPPRKLRLERSLLQSGLVKCFCAVSLFN
jgi:hypothetical protein